MLETNIVLYQAEWCPDCAKVRSKLTDLLLSYKIVNVPRERTNRKIVSDLSGQTGIPILVDGEVVVANDDVLPYIDAKYGTGYR